MDKKEIKIKNLEAKSSIYKLADNLISGTTKLLHKTKTEEDLRIGFEKLLEPVLKELGIIPNPRYEKSIYNAGRSDALHGQVVIEYELPNSFKSSKVVTHAYNQLIGYIKGLSKSEKETLFLFESNFVGVGFDGKKIFFVRYKGNKYIPKIELDNKDFILIGPYDFNEQSALTLLTHLRALARLPLTPENLADKFGSESELAPKAVSAFANSLEYWGDQTRVRTFFNEWKRLFGIVYGEQFSGHQQEEAKALIKIYKVGKETDFQELLFSIHTYFALLMKLIAAEILTLRETSFNSSLASELAHISGDELRNKLKYIENGGIYARKGITNFLEGDFFRWYLDAWSPQLEEAVQNITRALSEFEPATSTIEPSATRDLLKKLYQYLVPQEVRHRLGEYYTPDWLAELVLNEAGYKGNINKRLLDPACGSGTFLVLAIQRAKEFGLKEKWSPHKIATKIIANTWGFDLNPLAVIAARTNYLFALGDLVNEVHHIEIPIYLTDSVLTPNRTSGNLFGEFLEVSTSVGKFQVPAEWIRGRGLLLSKAAPLVEEMARSHYSEDEAMARFKKEGLVFSNNEEIVANFYANFYRHILELEEQNKNGIWARFLKNSFAPMIAGQFDFVVGNPPWIRWGYLSKEYREATLQMWKDYGLFSLKGHAARLGGGEKDFSMLFTYASADYYLKDSAKLGFLITQEVFKSKGAGEGFRQFKIGKAGKYLKVLKAHDLVTVQPFERAANKTSAIILQKGKKTTYPVSYILWKRKKGIGKIPTDLLLEEVLSILQKQKLIAQPIGMKNSSWQTISEAQKELRVMEGYNSYKAYRGASTEPYGVFWLNVEKVLSNGNLLIKNLSERGKKKVREVEAALEPDLVFPSICGGDIERWNVKKVNFLLVAQNPDRREPYSEKEMKNNWPRTYSYLVNFKEVLLSRASRTIKELAERTAFYAMYGIGNHTIANYKVVWKRMASDLVAVVVSQYKTPYSFKTVIPTDTTSFFATNNEAEAHYLCAIINSRVVRDFIRSFSSAGRGFGAPSVMEHLGIPKFNSKSKLHMKLAEISKKCHKFKFDDKEREVEKLEKENDILVKRLFKIK